MKTKLNPNDKQLQLFGISKLALDYKYKIISKLYCDGAKDLSDKTIISVFENTCLPTKLIALAKELRDNKVITISDLTK